MLVEVIKKDLPYVGKRGAKKEVPDMHANVLLRLGRVRKVEEPEPPPAVEEPPAESEEPKKPRRKRGYRRRDMGAEPVVE